VTHVPRFKPKIDKLEKKVQFKFFGEPREPKPELRKKRKKPQRNYFKQIL
jgi:hypothetical protein